MRTNKLVPLFLYLIILTALLLNGCEQQGEEQARQETEKSAVETEEQTPAETSEDTIEFREQAGLDTSYANLERSKSEFEKRLESLVFLIEEKEKSLLKREQRVLNREEMLMARAAALDERAEKLHRLQILSWSVLGLGIVGIVFGFVVASRKGSGAEKKRSPAAPVQTAKKEAETKDRKNEYFKKTEEQLKEWATGMEKVKGKAEAAKGDTKKEYQAQIDSFESKKEAAEKKLQELKKAGAAEWEKLKSDVEKAFADARKAFDNAIAKIK